MPVEINCTCNDFAWATATLGSVEGSCNDTFLGGATTARGIPEVGCTAAGFCCGTRGTATACAERAFRGSVVGPWARDVLARRAESFPADSRPDGLPEVFESAFGDADFGSPWCGAVDVTSGAAAAVPMPAMAVPMPNATANAPTRPTHMVMSICPTSRRFVGPRSYAAVICGNDDDEHSAQCVAFWKFIPDVDRTPNPFKLRQNSSLLALNASNRQHLRIQYLLNNFAVTAVSCVISTLGGVTPVTASLAGAHCK
ncbi:hypothetical protein EUA03_18005 [Mycolicibacterium mucogenicum]|uniref:Uncharacterized protein n=2 Tax=Mycolicibacterium mucogenicum TaxID=56689 RepID=A0A4R5WCU2_MYCMU|nr:hypothetical protein EUA03_18005 [Mycolicibacterium mucogenicum]